MYTVTNDDKWRLEYGRVFSFDCFCFVCLFLFLCISFVGGLFVFLVFVLFLILFFFVCVEGGGAFLLPFFSKSTLKTYYFINYTLKNRQAIYSGIRCRKH